MKIKIKPLSVNQAWQGRRFKTDVYKDYEIDVLAMLPPYSVPKCKVKLEIIVGFSSKLADIDNIAKPFIDILQKKYDFNDRNIYELHMQKKDVKKGEEYIEFEFSTLVE